MKNNGGSIYSNESDATKFPFPFLLSIFPCCFRLTNNFCQINNVLKWVIIKHCLKNSHLTLKDEICWDMKMWMWIQGVTGILKFRSFSSLSVAPEDQWKPETQAGRAFTMMLSMKILRQLVCAMTALLEQANVYRNRLTEELIIISITSHMLTNPIDFSSDTK